MNNLQVLLVTILTYILGIVFAACLTGWIGVPMILGSIINFFIFGVTMDNNCADMDGNEVMDMYKKTLNVIKGGKYE